MSGIELEDFEKKILEILKQKEDGIYQRIIEKLNLEERRVKVEERMLRVEEELKGQRLLMEKLLHQFDKRFEQVDKRFDMMHEEMVGRFEQVDKRFNILTWAMGIGFTLIISILVVVLNFVLKI